MFYRKIVVLFRSILLLLLLFQILVFVRHPPLPWQTPSDSKSLFRGIFASMLIPGKRERIEQSF